MIQEYHPHYIMGFVQLSFHYIYCYMYIFKIWRISIHHNLTLKKTCTWIKNILEKLYLIFFLHLKTRINLSGVLFLMEFPPLYLEQMMQWFLEMLRVWQKFQFLMTEKYLPSGWPSLVEVGDRPSWLSWWAKAALCCCKSSSWLCFSSLIFFYNTNVQTNLLRSCL